MKKIKFAILGAGAGGQSMAAILVQNGYGVRLYDNDADKIRRLNELGNIAVSGKIEASGFPEVVTTDISAAMEDADAVMVVTTTDAHREIAEKAAPYLKDGQVILLNPGHVGGALEFSQLVYGKSGFKGRVIIGETADLMYACRISETGKPFHSGIKKSISVATVPAGDVSELLGVLGTALPCLTAGKNILETGFSGGGAMLHPIPSFMNINRIDTGKPFDYYMEGITPGIAKLISAADKERLAVCEALGLRVPSLVESLKSMYNLEYDDLFELIQHNEPYKGVRSPVSTGHRFMVEDVACGIVPLASIGHELGVETPVLDAFVEIACVVGGRDFKKEGRTAEKLGLAGKSSEEILGMIS